MKIIAIGKNYLDHVKEFDGKRPENPLIFTKPDTALLRNNQPFYIPDFTNELHYETEIVVKINRVGKYIEPQFANRYYDEIGIGIDFTARDVQRKCIREGLPWEICKAFDNSAPISNVFIHKSKFEDVQNINFSMKLNGNIVQQANTCNMIWGVDDLISYISKYFTLKIGDLIFTGTPQGVGQVKPGDHIEAAIENDVLLDFYVK